MFFRIVLCVSISSCLLFLGACSGTRERLSSMESGPLTPLPYELIPQDPSDEILETAIRDYIKNTDSPAFTRFEYTRVDLNNDQRRDALVMMHGPHTYWCDMNGCSMVVFQAENDRFVATSEIFPVRGPLYVSENQTNGWKDLIIRVSGQSYAPAKNVALQFDGKQYPRNPFFQPGLEIAQIQETEIRLFP